MIETRYWIQEQAPDGGFVNSIGFHNGMTEKEAKEQLQSWQKTFPKRNCRLVLIITIPLSNN